MSRKRVQWAYIFAAFVVVATGVALPPSSARAAACVAPGSDFGVVTTTSAVSATGTYRIWTRMAAPNSTDTSYMLEIDGNTCFTIGGNTVPVYTDGSSARFLPNSSNWIRTTTGGQSVDVSLTAGSHSLKLIGLSEGVVIDRLLVTADTTCVPVAKGENCASIYIAADIDQNGFVDYIDFSRLSSRYGQSGASLGRSDINNDGVVDILDFSILASKYGS